MTKPKLPPTIPLLTLEPTDRPTLFRVVDSEGNWEWYYDSQKREFLGSVTSILQAGYPKDKRFYDYLLSVSKAESKEVLESTGDRGRRVHAAIQRMVDGTQKTLEYSAAEYSLSEWKCLLAWSAFVQEWQVRIVRCQRTVRGTGYCGTLDDIVELTVPESARRKYPESIGDTLRCLIDYKTSKAIYPSYGAQVASYWDADHGVKGISHTAILRLGTAHKNGPGPGCGYEVELWNEEETTDHLSEFFSARQFWVKSATIPTQEDLASSLPKSIVPKLKKIA